MKASVSRGAEAAGSGSDQQSGSELPEAGAEWHDTPAVGQPKAQDPDSASAPAEDQHDPELELLLEVARRATWNALHGPRHLRAGRFHPVHNGPPQSADATR